MVRFNSVDVGFWNCDRAKTLASTAMMPAGSKGGRCRSRVLLCGVESREMLSAGAEGPQRNCSKTGLRRKLI